MSLVINKQYSIIQFLGNTINISELPNVLDISCIYSVNTVTGDSYLAWESTSSFNSRSQLETYLYYIIITISTGPDFGLYDEVDFSDTASCKNICSI